MASSYTSLLKFNKPALGDAGWGTSVNGGFTDMVEQSLTGAVNVAVTSGGTTTVPTIADGVSSDARNQFITITGSLTSVQTATVQLPAGTSTNFKLYFVKNSAGGTVTVTTATGTNVAVPNGASMILRVTNAGVEETISHLSGTPTAATASPGTNTTQLATTAFVQAALPAAFPAGTAMLFVQTSAPTGWTKSTTHNDKALRVVSGAASSGGTTAFSTVFTDQTPTISNTLSVSNTTLTTTQIPSHTHNVGNSVSSAAAGCGYYWAGNTASVVSGATGGGGAHNHGLSGGITSTAVTLNVQYVDVIIATKD